MLPAKGRYTENERAHIEKWCKLARVVEAKRHKTTGVKQGQGVVYTSELVTVNEQIFSLNTTAIGRCLGDG
jgi:hypothetical protein